MASTSTRRPLPHPAHAAHHASPHHPRPAPFTMASPPPPRPIDAPAPVSPTFDAFWARQRPDPPRLRAPGRVDERHFASTLPPTQPDEPVYPYPDLPDDGPHVSSSTSALLPPQAMTTKPLPLFLPGSPSTVSPPPEATPAPSNSPISIHSSSPTPSPPRTRTPLLPQPIASPSRKRPHAEVYIDVPPFPPGLSARDYSPGIPPPSSSPEENSPRAEDDDDALRGPAGLALMMSRAAADNARLHDEAGYARSPSASPVPAPAPPRKRRRSSRPASSRGRSSLSTGAPSRPASPGPLQPAASKPVSMVGRAAAAGPSRRSPSPAPRLLAAKPGMDYIDLTSSDEEAAPKQAQTAPPAPTPRSRSRSRAPARGRSPSPRPATTRQRSASRARSITRTRADDSISVNRPARRTSRSRSRARPASPPGPSQPPSSQPQPSSSQPQPSSSQVRKVKKPAGIFGPESPPKKKTVKMPGRYAAELADTPRDDDGDYQPEAKAPRRSAPGKARAVRGRPGPAKSASARAGPSTPIGARAIGIPRSCPEEDAARAASIWRKKGEWLDVADVGTPAPAHENGSGSDPDIQVLPARGVAKRKREDGPLASSPATAPATAPLVTKSKSRPRPVKAASAATARTSAVVALPPAPRMISPPSTAASDTVNAPLQPPGEGVAGPSAVSLVLPTSGTQNAQESSPARVPACPQSPSTAIASSSKRRPDRIVSLTTTSAGGLPSPADSTSPTPVLAAQPAIEHPLFSPGASDVGPSAFGPDSPLGSGYEEDDKDDIFGVLLDKAPRAFSGYVEEIVSADGSSVEHRMYWADSDDDPSPRAIPLLSAAWAQASGDRPTAAQEHAALRAAFFVPADPDAVSDLDGADYPDAEAHDERMAADPALYAREMERHQKRREVAAAAEKKRKGKARAEPLVLFAPAHVVVRASVPASGLEVPAEEDQEASASLSLYLRDEVVDSVSSSTTAVGTPPPGDWPPVDTRYQEFSVPLNDAGPSVHNVVRTMSGRRSPVLGMHEDEDEGDANHEIGAAPLYAPLLHDHFGYGEPHAIEDEPYAPQLFDYLAQPEDVPPPPHALLARTLLPAQFPSPPSVTTNSSSVSTEPEFDETLPLDDTQTIDPSILKPPTPKTKWHHAGTTTVSTTAPSIRRMSSVHNPDPVGRFIKPTMRSLAWNDQDDKSISVRRKKEKGKPERQPSGRGPGRPRKQPVGAQSVSDPGVAVAGPSSSKVVLAHPTSARGGRGRGRRGLTAAPMTHAPSRRNATCHQCRRDNTYGRMECSTCTCNYCQLCLRSKYSGIIFAADAAGWECPRCTDICTCDVCARGRGEEYVRRKGRRRAATPSSAAAGGDALPTEQSPTPEPPPPWKPQGATAGAWHIYRETGDAAGEGAVDEAEAAILPDAGVHATMAGQVRGAAAEKKARSQAPGASTAATAEDVDGSTQSASSPAKQPSPPIVIDVDEEARPPLMTADVAQPPSPIAFDDDKSDSEIVPPDAFFTPPPGPAPAARLRSQSILPGPSPLRHSFVGNALPGWNVNPASPESATRDDSRTQFVGNALALRDPEWRAARAVSPDPPEAAPHPAVDTLKIRLPAMAGLLRAPSILSEASQTSITSHSSSLSELTPVPDDFVPEPAPDTDAPWPGQIPWVLSPPLLRALCQTALNAYGQEPVRTA